MENLKSIKKYQIFKNIDENDISALLRCFSARFVNIPKNTTFIHRGDRINNLYIITSGTVRDTITDIEGNINTYFDYHEGDILGLESFLTNRKTFLSDLQTETEVTAILIDSFRFTNPCQNFCPRHTQVIINTFSLIARQNQKLSERIKEITMRTTKDKIMCYLNNQKAYYKSSEFTIPFTHQELANYLGVERSALSKELGNLQKEGKITYHQKHFNLNK